MAVAEWPQPSGRSEYPMRSAPPWRPASPSSTFKTQADFSSYFVMLADPPAGFAGPSTYEALTKAGVPLFAHGNFITVAVNFAILALVIFVMMRQINRLKKAQPPAPPAQAPATPEDVLLLRQIRDSLAR